MTTACLDRTLGFIAETVAPLSRSRISRPDRGIVRRELDWTADVLRLACRLGIAWLESGFDQPLHTLPSRSRNELRSEIATLAERLRGIWRARSRPGGLDASMSRFVRLQELLRPSPPRWKR